MDSEILCVFLLSVFLGILIGFVIYAVADTNNYHLSQDTANELCQTITGNVSAVAVEHRSDNFGKLICDLSSYDSTQNIIIKSNSEEK